MMADQVLAQIKQEGLEKELDGAVRAATCVDMAPLQRMLARAEAECDPDYPIAPHLLALAQSRLHALLELQALRIALLGRLAHAVDVEVADEIDDVLTAIDATEEVNDQVRIKLSNFLIFITIGRLLDMFPPIPEFISLPIIFNRPYPT